MTKIYKLAANFNTVEFEITDDEVLGEITPEELEFDENDEVIFTDTAKENALKRILQREYDILASINVINVAPDIKQAKKIEQPSEKQIEFAKKLGMKNPEKHDKKTVWQYIQDHKND